MVSLIIAVTKDIIEFLVCVKSQVPSYWFGFGVEEAVSAHLVRSAKRKSKP